MIMSGAIFKLAYNGLAMCSSGIRSINFQNTTNDDSRTNVKERTNTAIAYSGC